MPLSTSVTTAAWCRHSPVRPSTWGGSFHSYTVREPYGVVGVITPWNAPLNQAARAAAPALAVGNAVVVKPSEFTPTTTLQFGALAKDAGLPDGLVGVVQGTGTTVGAALVRHSNISKLAFTGSVKTGQAVAGMAAERILSVSLELGGKSANIVFDDADLAEAARVAARAFLANSGQACSAGTRILVQRSVARRFAPLLQNAVRDFSNETPLGPLTTRTSFAKVNGILQDARNAGFDVWQVGSSAPQDGSEGLFIAPTILTGLDNSDEPARNEIFGPVGVVIEFDDEDEAISIANDSEYGLAGAVWTTSLERALRVVRRIESGQVYVNTWLGPTIDLPFGGFKKSGYGREKGFEAFHHYTHTKAVAIVLPSVETARTEGGQ